MDGRLAGHQHRDLSPSPAVRTASVSPCRSNMVRTVLRGATDRQAWCGHTWAARPAPGNDIARRLSGWMTGPAVVIIEARVFRAGAERAGYSTGRHHLAVDGFEVQDPEGLNFRIATLPVGDVRRPSHLRGRRAQGLLEIENRRRSIPPAISASFSGPINPSRAAGSRQPVTGLRRRIGDQSGGKTLLVLQLSPGFAPAIVRRCGPAMWSVCKSTGPTLSWLVAMPGRFAECDPRWDRTSFRGGARARYSCPARRFR